MDEERVGVSARALSCSESVTVLLER